MSFKFWKTQVYTVHICDQWENVSFLKRLHTLNTFFTLLTNWQAFFFTHLELSGYPFFLLFGWFGKKCGSHGRFEVKQGYLRILRLSIKLLNVYNGYIQKVKCNTHRQCIAFQSMWVMSNHSSCQFHSSHIRTISWGSLQLQNSHS